MPQGGSLAAVAAIDVISTLFLDLGIDETERCWRVSGLSFGVALEMDRAGAPLPEGQKSWAAFELRSQAAILDFVAEARSELFVDLVQNLRMDAGMRSMVYRNGMRDLLR